MITLDDYFTGSGKWLDRRIGFKESFTTEIADNAVITVERANALLKLFGEDRKVNSGWRPPAINAGTPGAAPFSKHMTGQAIDLSDPEGDLDDWLFGCTQHLLDLSLWMEHPASTKGWSHVQIVAPKSKRLVFFP